MKELFKLLNFNVWLVEFVSFSKFYEDTNDICPSLFTLELLAFVRFDEVSLESSVNVPTLSFFASSNCEVPCNKVVPFVDSCGLESNLQILSRPII